ncbi:hypothetical protein BDA96_09G225600 [Sorghum bicolor]|uniref:Uncharacterized protein n=2 Tax=Sorghum bicolor TaxID=4558 RepID=A0A921U5L3_SORBI|nr:hypothetical protein BDA96_09G225600 [Sorghum bicolor]KXG22434.1 hypothetical protein SORBI_3009G213700 [Sorghum bicolor]
MRQTLDLHSDSGGGVPILSTHPMRPLRRIHLLLLLLLLLLSSGGELPASSRRAFLVLPAIGGFRLVHYYC